MDDRGEDATLIGYSEEHPDGTYKVLKKNNQVIVGETVTFMENQLVDKLGEDIVTTCHKTDLHCPHMQPQGELGDYGSQPLNQDRGDDLGDPDGNGEDLSEYLPKASRIRWPNACLIR